MAACPGALLAIGPARLEEAGSWESHQTTVRDNFSAKTIRVLAARVGYHCSNPHCVCSTSGPALGESRTVNIGVGAHIAAASPGGKRYDATMTPAERSSGVNGIWLCQNCAWLIDSDETRYTLVLLHQWKKDAVQRALDAPHTFGLLPAGRERPRHRTAERRNELAPLCMTRTEHTER
jgi:hypothetical protein